MQQGLLRPAFLGDFACFTAFSWGGGWFGAHLTCFTENLEMRGQQEEGVAWGWGAAVEQGEDRECGSS